MWVYFCVYPIHHWGGMVKNVGWWKLITSLGQRLDIGMSAGMDTENVVNIFSSYFPVIFL